MATITTILSSGSDWDGREAGDGICCFFYDSTSEFYPGGIGSSLGYSNYAGPICYHADTFGDAPWTTAAPSNSSTAVNGVMNAYVGVGFDVRGNFSNTTDGKLGETLGTVTVQAGADEVASNSDTTAKPNTIAVRLGEAQYYRLHSVSHNLTSFPVGSAERFFNSPPVTLHQSVTGRDKVVFTSARVTLQNRGQRILVEIKDDVTGIYYPYHIADLNNGGYESVSNPDSLKVGLSFATSDAVTNCEIKNFTVQGDIIERQKSINNLNPPEQHNFYVAT
tara:strand:+ start:801 stop:1634 length:834 start_codon:yes stop_codon:yes gene_type:complete